MALDINSAIDAYLQWAAAVHLVNGQSTKTYRAQLRAVFANTLETPTASLTIERFARVAEDFRSRPTTRGRPYADPTILAMLRTTRVFCRWAHTHGHIKADPMREVPTIPNSERTRMDVVDGADMLTITAQADPLSDTDARDRAAAWTLWTTGVRVGELTRLLLRDFEWTIPHTDAAILVRRPEKHGIMRVVEVYDTAAATLNTYLTYHRPVLLGQARDPGHLFLSDRAGPLTTAPLSAKIARWAEAAGIPFRTTAHTMRHSAATLRAEAGADVEDLRRYMGWRTLQIALSYIHRTPRHALQRISQHRPPIRALAVEDRA